jgi:methylated-DNA-[protein]-cysteine S-methyltransferase
MENDEGRQREMTEAHTVSLPAANEPLSCTFIDSPVGRLLLAGDERGLWVLGFVSGKEPWHPSPVWRESKEPLSEAIRQLTAYFHRELRTFDLLLHPVGTDFQLSVWNALPSIPYGSTISYGELAQRIGKPAAVRAVGAANGQNPLAIILPCHRVIGANGKLVGYGGGLPNKSRLLALERGDLFA